MRCPALSTVFLGYNKLADSRCHGGNNGDRWDYFVGDRRANHRPCVSGQGVFADVVARTAADVEATED
jgi:hypothetical protein